MPSCINMSLINLDSKLLLIQHFSFFRQPKTDLSTGVSRLPSGNTGSQEVSATKHLFCALNYKRDLLLGLNRNSDQSLHEPGFPITRLAHRSWAIAKPCSAYYLQAIEQPVIGPAALCSLFKAPPFT